MKSINLTEGNVKKVLLSFAIPFFIANAMQAAYGAVDLFTVGMFCTTSAVSAVNIGSQAMQLITSFVIGISMGTTVMIGKASGENNQEWIEKIVQSSIWVLLVMGFVLTILMLSGGSTIVSWMQTPAAAIEETKTYIHFCSLGIPFITIFNLNAAIMRGMGNSKTPMKIVGITGVANIFGDLLLTGFFHLGVEGVAIATIASQAISAILSSVALFHSNISFDKFPFSCDKSCVKSVFSVGLPIAMQDTLINISFMILTLVADQRGLAASSAVGIVEKLIAFMFLVPSSMLSSVSAFTAQNSGAHKNQRIHECVVFAIAVTAGFGAVMCLLAWIIPDTLTSIFTKDPQVIEYAGQYIRSYSFDCILVGFTFVLNGYLSGIGNSIIAFIHNTIAIFVIRIPAAFLLSNAFPNTMFPMGLASPLGSVFSIIFLIIYFYHHQKISMKN